MTKRSPLDVGVLSEQLLALKQAHPGWHISYDCGIRVWSAFRHKFPIQRELDAGVRLLLKAPTAESLDEELKRQAEILRNLPTPPCSPGLMRIFIRR